jgi:glycosyltransferase involved in cell wall biosynthesis
VRLKRVQFILEKMKNKVAVIHDWLNGMRGGEKVLEEILDIFPGADIFTLFLEEENISDKIRAHKIIPSTLNKYSFIRKRYKYFLPLFPAVIEEFNLNGYDLVISISHCVAKGIVPAPDAVHISYVNSPMRYIWDRYHAYFSGARGLKRWFIKRQVSRLRTWDVAASSRVDHFIGNSNFIKKRIWRYYRREAGVIHPPVDTGHFCPADNPRRDYFLTVSALVPYKEVDLLIDAFNLCGERLIIVGKGPEEKKLKKMAGKNITFKKDLSADELKELFQHAAAFVFGGVEDFGIVFVEALACGTPVVAYKKGGAADIVDENTGVLFDHQTKEDIIAALDKVKRMNPDPSLLRESSLKFSRDNFKKKFRDFVQDVL